MYSSSLTRSQKLKHFNSAIAILRKLKELNSPKVAVTSDKESSYNNLIKSLKSLRKKVLPARQKSIIELVNEAHSKFDLSTFSLMEYHFDENTHSNILEYIFDYKLIGPIGAEILSCFIKKVSQEFEMISKLIKRKKYTVVREYSVNEGRIDLFIKDDINKFVIIIENKLLAPISIKDMDVDSSPTVIRTQLTNYYNAINKKFSSQSYKQAFILLSFSEIEESDKYPHFKLLDYPTLLKILDSFIYIKDNILDEYCLLLHSLGKLNPDELLKLKRDFSSYLHGYKVSNQNLNSIEQLRMFIYGNK